MDVCGASSLSTAFSHLRVMRNVGFPYTIMHAYRTELIMQELNLEGSGIALLQ